MKDAIYILQLLQIGTLSFQTISEALDNFQKQRELTGRTFGYMDLSSMMMYSPKVGTTILPTFKVKDPLMHQITTRFKMHFNVNHLHIMYYNPYM